MDPSNQAAAEGWQANWRIIDDNARSGGQGAVRKVQSLVTGEFGALKELHERHRKVRERRFRVQQEVSALRFLDGVGTPRVLESNADQWDSGNVPLYLISEWVEGPTLTQVSGGKPVPLDEALSCIRRLADTLMRAHGGGVVHRDLKPDNVVCRGGVLADSVLLDFGMAWRRSEEDALPAFVTPVGTEVGNRFLRLPEHAPGAESHDERSDVAALVGLLFYLITGHAPRLLTDENGRMPHERGMVPQALQEDARWSRLASIFQTGFQHSIDFRYRSISTLVAALQRLDTAPSSDLSALEESLDRINALEASQMAREADTVRELLELPISELERHISNYFSEKEFRVEVHRFQDRPAASTLHFRIRRLDREAPSASGNVYWRVEAGLLHAEYVVFRPGPLDQQPGTVFYEGPAADTAAVLDAQSQIFASLAMDLLKRFEDATRAVLEHRTD